MLRYVQAKDPRAQGQITPLLTIAEPVLMWTVINNSQASESESSTYFKVLYKFKLNHYSLMSKLEGHPYRTAFDSSKGNILFLEGFDLAHVVHS